MRYAIIAWHHSHRYLQYRLGRSTPAPGASHIFRAERSDIPLFKRTVIPSERLARTFSSKPSAVFASGSNENAIAPGSLARRTAPGSSQRLPETIFRSETQLSEPNTHI